MDETLALLARGDYVADRPLATVDGFTLLDRRIYGDTATSFLERA